MNLTKFFSFFLSIYRSLPAHYLCVLHLFLKFWLKKLFEWFSSIFETVAAKLPPNRSVVAIAICYIKMPKLIKFHWQPGAPRKRSVTSVNDPLRLLLPYSENSVKTTRVSRLLLFVWLWWILYHNSTLKVKIKKITWENIEYIDFSCIVPHICSLLNKEKWFFFFELLAAVVALFRIFFKTKGSKVWNWTL